MSDGHTGLSNSQVNEGGLGNFKLVLTSLKQGSGKSELVMHVTSNTSSFSGLEPYQFLSGIGLKEYMGQCQVLPHRCFYHVVAVLPDGYYPMEHIQQVQIVHATFKDFAEKIGQLYQLYQQEASILRVLGLKPTQQTLFGQPMQIEVKETDVPLWVNDVKLPQLRTLEEQKDALQKQIDDLNQFLPLLYGSGYPLEVAVIHTLQFLGLDAEKTEKSFTIDVRAQTHDGTKKFGLEVTGLGGQVKKDNPKLTQLMQFDLIKEHDEKTILVANTHNKTPISQRMGLEDFTPQVLNFLSVHPILLLTGWDLYCIVRDVLAGAKTKEELVEMLYTTDGRLKYIS